MHTELLGVVRALWVGVEFTFCGDFLMSVIGKTRYSDDIEQYRLEIEEHESFPGFGVCFIALFIFIPHEV